MAKILPNQVTHYPLNEKLCELYENGFKMEYTFLMIPALRSYKCNDYTRGGVSV